ncbi:hypothetical protein MHYP_G00102340 [Metynnis hypsauchen]
MLPLPPHILLHQYRHNPHLPPVSHLQSSGHRPKPPDDDSFSVEDCEDITNTGLRALPPDDDTSSAHDYENITGSGLNAPPPDDDSFSSDDYKNITDNYENVTVSPKHQRLITL